MMVEAMRNLSKKGIVAWDLCMRNRQLQWSSSNSRVLQAGDSAHSFVPTSGSGAMNALEDGMSLAECLRLGGKEDLPTAVKVHELLRYACFESNLRHKTSKI